MDQWKSKQAVNTKLRTLDEAIKGADVFLGLSTKNVLSKAMVCLLYTSDAADE